MDFIAGFIAGELDAAEQHAFEAHLEACPDCAAFLRTYKKTVETTRSFLRGLSAKTPMPRSTPRH